jgi:hypothetical protein
MNKTTIVYLPLSADTEIEIRLTRRSYNGIASDPKVITGEPSASEVFAVAKALRGTHLKFSTTPTLDYPES